MGSEHSYGTGEGELKKRNDSRQFSIEETSRNEKQIVNGTEKEELNSGERE